ncbi:MAG: adenylate/guanylate cyclase [Alphaproteobacteria bacterium]|nr:adenylate/guanylate cyclase [Alphaproteobacteria bacterium]
MRSLMQIGRVRVLAKNLFILFALLLARYSWDDRIPLAGDAERALYDLRFIQAAKRVDQDTRIVLVTFDDQTLAMLGKRSPLDRKMLSDTLKALDSLGPKAIGIDIIFDQPQPEDPILIDTFRHMKTPTFIGYTTNAENESQMDYWQAEFLRGFLREASSGPVRPSSIHFEPDKADNVIRIWPPQPPSLPPLFAPSMARVHPEFRSYTRSIDFELPSDLNRGVFTNLPIQTVTAFPEALRSVIAGRYVLIGGNINDEDDYSTPMSRTSGKWMKGLEVHAQMLAQLLDNRVPAEIPNLALWLAAIFFVLAGAGTSLVDMRGWNLALVIGVQVALVAGLPFELQRLHFDTYGLPAIGWGIGWIIAFTAVGVAARAVGSEQRRFAQSALGKYLPPDVAALILREPERLSLTGEKRQIYALFTDLEGFTKLSHAVTAEQLSILLNRYLDLLSEIVLRHGGTIDKFVGDAVVAFWGAPIARDDDADRAVKAAVAMFEAGEAFRHGGGDDLPPIGCTRVGLHRGDAVVGNFGGEGRIQYTALGDGMNTASRLESANKQLHSSILVSLEAKQQATLDIFRPLGRVVLSGRATPVEVWEPVPHMPVEERHRLAELWRQFDGGDLDALAEMEALAAEKSDAALDNMVYRLKQAGPGGHFVLGSK